MTKVFITGITGFLGSHTAIHLISMGYQVIGTKRKNSNLSRLGKTANEIDWVDLTETEDWKSKVLFLKPDICIHCAWIGVNSKTRNNWKEQGENVQFFIDLCDLILAANIRKFIVLGSQSEYGFINQIVSEEDIANPNSAYGAIKLSCYNICKAFCEDHSINWIWLRVFSVFGEGEGNSWLLPSLIKRLETDIEMDLTEGTQKYAYLYIRDFVNIMGPLVKGNILSGVYNVSGSNPIQLRQIITYIRDKVNPKFSLNFGKIPQRSMQSTHIEGNTSKLVSQIGVISITQFEAALNNTIIYYLNQDKE